jgi:Cof subfamily protein (haloacid dehalogenase superfamily)
MIRVIAVDMDGTLLNSKHEISQNTIETIRKAIDSGIEFIIATGRSLTSAMDVLKKYDFRRHYIVASGANIHDIETTMIKSVMMDYHTIERIYQLIKHFPIAISFCTDRYDYMIGEVDTIKNSIIEEAKSFSGIEDSQEIESSEAFQTMLGRIKSIDSINELNCEEIEIFKIFIFSRDIEMLQKIDAILTQVSGIASASSFLTNIEITNIEAQKGIALKEYIESLGYQMDEVMVLGDSMNDYSMLSMDFGATVAMENAMDRIKEVSKYITKSNDEDGVAYAIQKVLDGKVEDLRISFTL